VQHSGISARSLAEAIRGRRLGAQAIEQSDKRPLTALVREAKAAARIAVSFVELAGSSRSRLSSTRKIEGTCIRVGINDFTATLDEWHLNQGNDVCSAFVT
jgi:hypothetical protein